MENVNRIPIEPPNTLSYALGVKGLHSRPDYADMSAVIPTFDMGVQGYSLLHDYEKWDNGGHENVSLAALTTLTHSWLSVDNTARTAGDVLQLPDHHFVPFACSYHVDFDAAGIAAFNPTDFFVHVRLYNRGGLTWWTHVHWDNFNTNPGCLFYFPGWAGSAGATSGKIKLPVVPCGCAVDISVTVQDAVTAFPANTEISFKMLGINVPIGSPLPIQNW